MPQAIHGSEPQNWHTKSAAPLMPLRRRSCCLPFPLSSIRGSAYHWICSYASLQSHWNEEIRWLRHRELHVKCQPPWIALSSIARRHARSISKKDVLVPSRNHITPPIDYGNWLLGCCLSAFDELESAHNVAYLTTKVPSSWRHYQSLDSFSRRHAHSLMPKLDTSHGME